MNKVKLAPHRVELSTDNPAFQRTKQTHIEGVVQCSKALRIMEHTGDHETHKRPSKQDKEKHIPTESTIQGLANKTLSKYKKQCAQSVCIVTKIETKVSGTPDTAIHE